MMFAPTPATTDGSVTPCTTLDEFNAWKAAARTTGDMCRDADGNWWIWNSTMADVEQLVGSSDELYWAIE